MKKNKTTDYTPEIVAELKRLYTETNLSHHHIAVELNKMFGTELTRNSIIGKVNRLKINDGRSSTVKKSNMLGQHGEKKVKKRVPKIPKVIAPPVASKPTPPVQEYNGATTVPAQHPVDIQGLTDSTCRWPIGGFMAEPPYEYCGGAAVEGTSYCRNHCQVAFVAPRANVRPYDPIRDGTNWNRRSKK